MSGKNYVATKSTNSLLVRTQGLLTEITSQEVELQWGRGKDKRTALGLLTLFLIMVFGR